MAEWLNAFSVNKGIAPQDIHIVNIQGNIGASAQIGRTRGLEQGVAKYGWDLLDQVSGEFTQAKGKEVMEAFLKKYDNINVVYCENDNEAFGARGYSGQYRQSQCYQRGKCSQQPAGKCKH